MIAALLSYSPWKLVALYERKPTEAGDNQKFTEQTHSNNTSPAPYGADSRRLGPCRRPSGPMAHKLNGSRRTIAVDFDGVIAEYDGYKGPTVLGDPRKDVAEALLQLRSEGWKIVIHTTRGEREIALYLAQHVIAYDEINRNSDYTTGGPKPVADVYWDDRALAYSGDAQKDLALIRSFRTWSGRE